MAFRDIPSRLRVTGLFWLVELVVAIGGVGFGAMVLSQDAIFGTFVLATAGFLMATSFAFLSDIRFRLSSSEPTIEVSEAGFLDRRLTREPIPWDQILAIPYYWYRQRSLAVILKEDSTTVVDPIFALKFQEWLGKLLNMPGYPVIIAGNEGTVDSIEAAIRRHAPQLVRPPQQ
ncbi:hypothetical protein ACKTEK_13375 [Tepidamorphus sp. 3E244]|uniref:hypothetical protein n=1 Tax=Tepidamorphus sp. 3E244 TaxID=3385498 RepID=UPI0038FC5EB8